MQISERFGANLPPNFPVIDTWLNKIATSITSIDLRTARYQNAPRLTYRVNTYIDKLAMFDGATMGAWDIKSAAIKGRVLSIVVPKGSVTEMQKAVFAAAKIRAQAFDRDLIVMPF
jgi:filamentous hemagglutinin